MSQDFDDAQRTLEQKALRNVRGLVDRIESEESNRHFTTFKVFVFVMFWVVLGIGILIVVAQLRRPSEESQRASIEAAQSKVDAFNRSRAIYDLGPRKTYVDARMEPRFEKYVAGCNAKIDNLRDTTYRSELAGIEGKARVTYGVRFDGIIETAEVKEWSGHPATEATARRMVKLAGSCGDFPDEIRKDTEVLYITRNIEFGSR
jgi:outer membrane biosynthesis protein TonB